MSIDLVKASERILAGREPAEYLMSDARALAKGYLELAAAAKADADDLAQMRDGTKLTRAGLVMVIQFLQNDLRAIATEKQKWTEGVGSYAGGETNAAFAARLQRMAELALH